MTLEGLQMGIKRRSLTGGEIFGRLKVVEYIYSSKRKDGSAGERIMKCLCECGNETNVKTSNLYSGNTLSCGCLKSERTANSNRKRKEDDES